MLRKWFFEGKNKDALKLIFLCPKRPKKKDNDNSKDDSLKLYGNDINDKKPRYFGTTKSLLFIGETPFLILGQDSNFYIN